MGLWALTTSIRFADFMIFLLLGCCFWAQASGTTSDEWTEQKHGLLTGWQVEKPCIKARSMPWLSSLGSKVSTTFSHLLPHISKLPFLDGTFRRAVSEALRTPAHRFRGESGSRPKQNGFVLCFTKFTHDRGKTMCIPSDPSQVLAANGFQVGPTLASPRSGCIFVKGFFRFPRPSALGPNGRGFGSYHSKLRENPEARAMAANSTAKAKVRPRRLHAKTCVKKATLACELREMGVRHGMTPNHATGGFL